MYGVAAAAASAKTRIPYPSVIIRTFPNICDFYIFFKVYCILFRKKVVYIIAKVKNRNLVR